MNLILAGMLTGSAAAGRFETTTERSSAVVEVSNRTASDQETTITDLEFGAARRSNGSIIKAGGGTLRLGGANPFSTGSIDGRALTTWGPLSSVLPSFVATSSTKTNPNLESQQTQPPNPAPKPADLCSARKAGLGFASVSEAFTLVALALLLAKASGQGEALQRSLCAVQSPTRRTGQTAGPALRSRTHERIGIVPTPAQRSAFTQHHRPGTAR